jgi:trimethylamine:corrinoid methyltransferase-like protein
MAVWPRILNAYTPPPMDAGRIEEMQAYIAQRKEQIGSDAP